MTQKSQCKGKEQYTDNPIYSLTYSSATHSKLSFLLPVKEFPGTGKLFSYFVLHTIKCIGSIIVSLNNLWALN